MHELLLASPLRTLSGDDADVFFVPLYHKCISNALRKNTTAITAFYDQLLDRLRNECVRSICGGAFNALSWFQLPVLESRRRKRSRFERKVGRRSF